MRETRRKPWLTVYKKRTNPNERVLRLEAAKKRANKFGATETLTAKPMSELLGVSWVTLRGWCNDVPGFADSGSFIRGSEGINYEFWPRQTANFLIGHFKGLAKAQVKQATLERKRIGGDELADVPPEFNLDEIVKMLRVQRELRQEREMQNALMDVRRAERSFRAYHQALQEAVLQSAQEQDPNGRWSPEMRESVENVAQSIMLKLHKAGEAVLADLNGSPA